MVRQIKDRDLYTLKGIVASVPLAVKLGEEGWRLQNIDQLCMFFNSPKPNMRTSE